VDKLIIASFSPNNLALKTSLKDTRSGSHNEPVTSARVDNAELAARMCGSPGIDCDEDIKSYVVNDLNGRKVRGGARGAIAKSRDGMVDECFLRSTRAVRYIIG